MSQNKDISIKWIYRLTFCAFVVSLICLFVFNKVISSSGDTGIAMWAIFIFTFTLVSAPLHGFLFVLTLIQSFRGFVKSLRWVYLYILVTVSGHLAIAAKHGAFTSSSVEVVQLTPTQKLMRSAFSRGTTADITKLRQAISQGVDVNSGDYNGFVPYLVKAASYADVAAIQLLLNAGADPNKPSQLEYMPRMNVSINNASPLDVVMFADHGDILKSIEVLLNAGASPENTLLKLGACRKGDLSLFEYANSLGAKTLQEATELVDANGKNCLHHAAEANQAAFLQALLFEPKYKEENAQHLLEIANEYSKFPLDLALILKNYESALVIIKAGGKTNQTWSQKEILENIPTSSLQSEIKALLLEDTTEQ